MPCTCARWHASRDARPAAGREPHFMARCVRNPRGAPGALRRESRNPRLAAAWGARDALGHACTSSAGGAMRWRRSINCVARHLQDGESVMIFPEGTTTDGTELLPFHSNLFASALHAAAPVWPVVLRYTELRHADQRSSVHRRHGVGHVAGTHPDRAGSCRRGRATRRVIDRRASEPPCVGARGARSDCNATRT
jgi:hypothetical protein